MAFISAVRSCFRKWLVFRGRASGSEFWYFFLFYVLIEIAAKVLDYGLGLNFYASYIALQQDVLAHDVQQLILSIGNGPIEWICFLATIPPLLSVTVRRLHDRDKSGWWYWIILTVIGIIPLLIWLCQRGTARDNRYGADPLSPQVLATGSFRRADDPPAAITGQTISEQLESLARLYTAGHLSQQEYQAAKGKLLGATGGPNQITPQPTTTRSGKPVVLAVGATALVVLAALGWWMHARLVVWKQATTATELTSEDIRLADLRKSRLTLEPGRTYRVIGRIRNIGVSDSGLPQITFTGLEATFSSQESSRALEKLAPDTFVSVECRLGSRGEAVFVQLIQCDDVQQVQAASADQYKAAYDRNPFKADTEFKGRGTIVYGKVRLTGKLTGGEDYVSFETQGGFSDLVAIPSLDSVPLMHEYARKDSVAVMYCYGGHRWNMVGDVGLRDCRFLQNY